LCRGIVVSTEYTDVVAASGKYITEFGCDLWETTDAPAAEVVIVAQRQRKE
jgi:hypothetical protein